MTELVWQRFAHVTAEIDALQRQIRSAEAERNYGLARILAGRIAATETTRDRMLKQLANTVAETGV